MNRDFRCWLEKGRAKGSCVSVVVVVVVVGAAVLDSTLWALLEEGTVSLGNGMENSLSTSCMVFQILLALPNRLLCNADANADDDDRETGSKGLLEATGRMGTRS